MAFDEGAVMTQDVLGLCIEDCKDSRMQSLLLEDAQMMLWPADCEIPLEIFYKEEIEYSADSFQMADVLEQSWSACANGLN